MNFKEFQRHASSTRVVAPDSSLVDDRQLLQMYLAMGLSDNAGRIVGTVRKRLRTKGEFSAYEDEIIRSLGDCLWFMSELVTALGRNLEEIAASHVEYTARRWHGEERELYDEGLAPKYQFPRFFKIRFKEEEKSDVGYSVVSVYDDAGQQIGDSINDNKKEQDGYRFHDAMHLAHVAVLGWSPVMRKMLKRKRKDDDDVDRIDDGARAADTEEVVVRYVFAEAKRYSLFKEVERVDTKLLEAIQYMVRDLEVRDQAPRQWEKAILEGYEIHRKLIEHGGGVVAVDMRSRELTFEPLVSGDGEGNE